MTYQELLQEFGVGGFAAADIALLTLFEADAGVGIVDVSFMFDADKLKGALSAIELGSNEPSGIPDEYDTWIRVMFALKEAVERKEIDETLAYEYWIEWSNLAGNLDMTGAERRWQTSNSTGHIGLGTIFYLAKEAGWNGRKARSWTEEEWLNKERERRGIKVKIYAKI